MSRSGRYFLSLSLLVGAALSAPTATPDPNDIVFAEDFVQYVYDGVQSVLNGSIPMPSECTQCYAELGCFDACKGTFYYIHELPENPDKLGVKFTLYTRENKETGVTFGYKNVSLALPLLKSSRNTMFAVHGFSSSGSADWITQLKDNSLNDDDCNFIVVDWENGCKFPFYPAAVVNTEIVGRMVAVVLNKLVLATPDNVNPGLVHYVGHSLGAQVAKFFSDYFKVLNGATIGRITGLDAAAPLFEKYNVGLDKSSANYVDAIHTSAGDDILTGKMGVTKQIGHLDLYVNGGSDQPNCLFFELTCDHGRSHDYYVQAARLDTARDCAFASYACVGGRDQYLAGKCVKVAGKRNGISLDKSYSMPGRGMEFVDTTGTSPFCE